MRFTMPNRQTNGSDQLAGGIGSLFKSLTMAPLYQAQAADEAAQSEAKMGLMRSQQGQYDSATALNQGKLGEITTQAERSTPGAMLRNAALMQGIPLSQTDDFARFAETGLTPQRYDAPGDGVGPTQQTAPLPVWQTNGMLDKAMKALGLSNQAMAVGDKSVLNIANATGAYQDQDLTGEAANAARTGDYMTMGALSSVRGKKAFEPYKAVGETGVSLNQVTGAQDIKERGLNALFGSESAAKTGKDKAAAANSYASAGQHTAARDKIKQEIEQGGKTGQVQMMTDANGNIVGVNKQTLVATPVMGADGKPLTSAKAVPQGQKVQDARDALSTITMAEKLIDEATGSGFGNAMDATAGFFGASTAGAQGAARLKALEGDLVSKMPKMSGPQSDKDVILYRQMAGTIGDPTIPRETKKAALKTIRDIQNRYAGVAPEGSWDGAQPAAVSRISSDAEYQALPSGATFIGPDGRQRRKP